MDVWDLRRKYKTFRYAGFDIQYRQKYLTICYSFEVEPDLSFRPKIQIPIDKSSNLDGLELAVFHLGLIEAISYWKAVCSPEFVVEAGVLSDSQMDWWHKLFISGLGEFYFCNNIDFTNADFLKFYGDFQAPSFPKPTPLKNKGTLVLVGGGKDSAVTLGVLSGSSARQKILIVNHIESALSMAKKSGFEKPLFIKRMMDPLLFQLNRKGFLNGHTPFSAYLSFAALLIAYIHGYDRVVVSNESSANEGSLNFKGLSVNHQFSKSFVYEKMFRSYVKKHISSDIDYFSLLRPLNELQIAYLYSRSDKYDDVFVSCNAQGGKMWCRKCPKCAFAYLILSPFLDRQRLRRIFGYTELFDSPLIQKHILDMAGLGGHKPFECVGTQKETQTALFLTATNYQNQGLKVPEFVEGVIFKLRMSPQKMTKQIATLMRYWDEENFVPTIYQKIIKDNLKGLGI